MNMQLTRKLTFVFAIMAAAVVTFGAVAVFFPAKTSAVAATACTKQEFSNKRGSYGNCVKYIQGMLRVLVDKNLKADKDFGPKTHAAVVSFQRSQKIGVDGIVGPQTWGKLCDNQSKFKNIADLAGCTAVDPQKANCTKMSFSVNRNKEHTCVGKIQFLLNLGNNAGIKMNDNFDQATHKAVKHWQVEKNLKYVDGIVGPETWGSICRHKMSTKPAQDVYRKWANMAGCKV